MPRVDHLRERLLPLVGDTVQYLAEAREGGRRLLLEGGQATMLDIDFGTYPFVTSSNPSIGGLLAGLGVPPQAVEAIIGVVRGRRFVMWVVRDTKGLL